VTTLSERPVKTESPPGSGSLTPAQRVLGRDWRMASAFMAPTVLLIAGLILIPIFYSVVTSTTERHGAETVFVGLDNYTALVDDKQFHTGVLNSFVFTAYAEVFKVVLGLIAALMLHHMKRGRAVLAGVLLVVHTLTVLVVRRRQGFSLKDLHPPLVSP
jgi:multiple sugar transport system permease protein